MNNSKIITVSEVKSMPGSVLVGGCFDIFHYGHLTFLKKSREFGDSLVVELESDEFIVTNKKRKPFHTQMQRAEILAELECVDGVILLPFFHTYEQYRDITHVIRPSVISITEGDKQFENKVKQANGVGAIVKTLPMVLSFSSTKAYDAVVSRD